MMILCRYRRSVDSRASQVARRSLFHTSHRRVARGLGLLAVVFIAAVAQAVAVETDRPAAQAPADQEVTCTGKVTLYRDTWGVPHVYADTLAAGGFGLGYAQAEDRLADVFQAVRTGLGRMAEAFGPKYVEQDYIMHLVRNAELCRQRWNDASPEYRQLAVGFTRGVQAYMKEHPEDVPDYAIDLEPWMWATVGRAMILRWPLGTIQDELGRRDEKSGPPMRSNQWVVSPQRSATGGAILLSDPHLTWEGLAVLYEARVHAADLHMNGFFLIGSPLIGIGHNRHVGWANTTGGPDTADVYRMKFRLNLIPQYEYDGQWRTCKLKMATIRVKGADKPVKRPMLYTHLGPVVMAPDKETGIGYVAATPYLDSTRLFDQFYRMSMSRNVYEFRDALGMNEYNEQNMMCADTSGNIGYIRNGATPIRPKGYDWSRPVPGTTSATAWQGIHPVEDLVQIFNPPQGYMQNCNISPANMMIGSPLTPDKYPDYIFNVSWDTTNPRGQRATQILHNDDHVTVEDALRYAFDVKDILSEKWQSALARALDAVGKPYRDKPHFNEVAQAILSWDGQFTTDSRVTMVYQQWRVACNQGVDLAAVLDRPDPPATEQRKMLDRLVTAIDQITKRYGRWNVPWGDVHKIGRGGKLFPCAGTDFGSRHQPLNYTETLFDVSYRPSSDDPNIQVAYKGSMSLILMFFSPEGIRSMTCINWGQSGHPDSPHYVDQAEKLYSRRQMKPTWWTLDELKPHIASTKTFTLP